MILCDTFPIVQNVSNLNFLFYLYIYQIINLELHLKYLNFSVPTHEQKCIHNFENYYSFFFFFILLIFNGSQINYYCFKKQSFQH